MFAYFDCFAGISGDMILGAFIDLGIPIQWLEDSLRKIPLKNFDISVSSISRSKIKAKSVDIIVKNDAPSRNYSDIKALLQDSSLSENVKKTSLKVFEKLASAEAKIHNCPKEKVHFHEVGGVDAIVDIVGTALCIEYLEIENITASKIPLGSGFVSCKHGILPVPAPATLEILKGVPVYGLTNISHEITTPTGAAIISSIAESFATIPNMTIKKIGYGAGKKNIESMPNLLRVIVGTSLKSPAEYEKDKVTIVETCIDDMNPEIFGFVMERLFENGALDVYWIPIFMKKNRPGTMMQVICPENCVKAVIHCILSETTSTGVRRYDAERNKLRRENIDVKTSYGIVNAKRIKYPDKIMRIVPEYEVCKKIALARNIPIRIVYDKIMKEAC